MRKNIYLYIGCLSILLILFLVWSCMDDELINMDSRTENKNFSLQEAKAFFEKSMESVTTRSEKEKADNSIRPGDFSPQWTGAIPSSKHNLECYDIPIISTFQYKALYVEYKNDKGIAKHTNVYQKLVIVKDVKENNVGQYILTLIPAKEYDAVHNSQVCNDFINCVDKGTFTGIAIYSMVHSSMIARINTYKNGIKVKGVFLLNASTQAELEEKRQIANFQLSGLAFGRKKKISTRSGEDDLWDGEDWSWDIDGGNLPEVIITPEPGDINGGQFPEVTITPDDWLTPIPPPDPDPFPDPSEMSTGNPDESTGNGTVEEKEEKDPDVDPCEKANEMNVNDSLIARVKKIFAGVYYQPNSKENGWIASGASIHNPNKQGQGSIRYDWSAVKPNSVTEWYHSHPGGSMIPSFADLNLLTQKYLQGYIDVENFSYGIISDFGCNSLVIVSEDAFRDFATKLQNDKETMKQEYSRALNSAIGASIEDRIAHCVSFLQKEGAGLQFIFNYCCPVKL